MAFHLLMIKNSVILGVTCLAAAVELPGSSSELRSVWSERCEPTAAPSAAAPSHWTCTGKQHQKRWFNLKKTPENMAGMWVFQGRYWCRLRKTDIWSRYILNVMFCLMFCKLKTAHLLQLDSGGNAAEKKHAVCVVNMLINTCGMYWKNQSDPWKSHLTTIRT